MKYFARLLFPALLLAACIAGAEEEDPEFTLDPSGYRSSKPEFVVAPDSGPDLITGQTEQRQKYPMNRLGRHRQQRRYPVKRTGRRHQ